MKMNWRLQWKWVDVHRLRFSDFCVHLKQSFMHIRLTKFEIHNLFMHGFHITGNNIRIMKIKWAPSSEFVSSSIPSWQILTAHAQPFRGARDLAFCLKVPLDSLLVWASSEGSGETARMRRLAWTFAARIGDKYQIRLTRSKYVLHYLHHGTRLYTPKFLAFSCVTAIKRVCRCFVDAAAIIIIKLIITIIIILCMHKVVFL